MRLAMVVSGTCVAGCIAGVGPSIAVKAGSGAGIHVGVEANFGVASTQDAAMQSTTFIGGGIGISRFFALEGTSGNSGYGYGQVLRTLSPIVTDGGSAVGTFSVIGGVAVSRREMVAVREWRPTDRSLDQVSRSEVAAAGVREACIATRSALFERARQAKDPEERRTILTRSVGSTTFSNVPHCDVPGSAEVEDGKLLVTTDLRAFDLTEAHVDNDRLVGKVIHVWTIEAVPVGATGTADAAEHPSLAGEKVMRDTAGQAPTEIASSGGWQAARIEEPSVALDLSTIRYARASVVARYDTSAPRLGPLIGVGAGYLGGIDGGFAATSAGGCGVHLTASVELGLRWRGDGLELYLTPKANLVEATECPLYFERVAPTAK